MLENFGGLQVCQHILHEVALAFLRSISDHIIRHIDMLQLMIWLCCTLCQSLGYGSKLHRGQRRPGDVKRLKTSKCVEDLAYQPNNAFLTQIHLGEFQLLQRIRSKHTWEETFQFIWSRFGSSLAQRIILFLFASN